VPNDTSYNPAFAIAQRVTAASSVAAIDAARADIQTEKARINATMPALAGKRNDAIAALDKPAVATLRQQMVDAEENIELLDGLDTRFVTMRRQAVAREALHAAHAAVNTLNAACTALGARFAREGKPALDLLRSLAAEEARCARLAAAARDASAAAKNAGADCSGIPAHLSAAEALFGPPQWIGASLRQQLPLGAMLILPHGNGDPDLWTPSHGGFPDPRNRGHG